MRRLWLPILCVLALSLPALAQSQTAPLVLTPDWSPPDQKVIAEAHIQKDKALGAWTGFLDFSWAQRMTDNIYLGSALSYQKDQGISGAGVGAFFEYTLPPYHGGNAYIGGDAKWLTGDIGSEASSLIVARIGWEQHIGTQSALRFSVQGSRPLGQPTVLGKDLLNDVSFIVGASFGFTRPLPPASP